MLLAISKYCNSQSSQDKANEIRLCQNEAIVLSRSVTASDLPCLLLNYQIDTVSDIYNANNCLDTECNEFWSGLAKTEKLQFFANLRVRAQSCNFQLSLRCGARCSQSGAGRSEAELRCVAFRMRWI